MGRLVVFFVAFIVVLYITFFGLVFKSEDDGYGDKLCNFIEKHSWGLPIKKVGCDPAEWLREGVKEYKRVKEIMEYGKMDIDDLKKEIDKLDKDKKEFDEWKKRNSDIAEQLEDEYGDKLQELDKEHRKLIANYHRLMNEK